MNIGQSSVHCVFRDIGKSGLVVFERDGLLLTNKQPGADLMLSDVNEELIETLHWLRHQGARFGFVSVNSECSPGDGARFSWHQATTVIDALLDVREATPDFWIFGGSCQPANRSSSHLEEDGVKLLSRVIDWYDVHPSQAFLLSSASSTAQAGHGVSIRTFQAGGEPDENLLPTIELTDPEPITFADLQKTISRLSIFA